MTRVRALACMITAVSGLAFAPVVLSGSPPEIRSVSQAFRQLDLPRIHPILTPEATQWVLERAGLDWPMVFSEVGSQKVRGWGNEWVVAVPSPRATYCVLSAAKEEQWGQIGEARYALVDSTGRVRWIREGRICAPPAVANDGVAALLMLGGASPLDVRLDTLRVDFLAPDGKRTGTAAWGNRVRRTWQRGFEDPYGFSPEGERFLITVNHFGGDDRSAGPAEPASGRQGSNHSTLYAVSPRGNVLWRHELGPMAPNELWFSSDGDRAVVTDLRTARAGRENQVFVFDSGGTLIARRTATEGGADGSVLDPVSGLLFFFTFENGLMALDVETGDLASDAPVAPLIRLARTGRPREASRAEVILDRLTRE